MSEAGSNSKQGPSLKARALRLLSLREYSRKGLGAKLEEAVARSAQLNKKRNVGALDQTPISSEQIAAVLDDFEARGWLSDERFAESLVRRRSERFGARKIQDELQRAGIDSSKTQELVQTLRDTELQRAYELWLRKFGQLAQEQKERARQYRFLVSKGFSSEIVSKVVAGRLGQLRSEE
ncbi:regulatory protein [Polynucleobacter meluiroseus]|uniref:Regulatory protein RecX n=1 Tax=Polynucleobacter meluiroseus TaxID=1938814 RepID=A0A240DY74_9BURK|nr:RecX family transcriptional regulator [Polynucleobacter meluiroseus]SNX27917.1 regulatory protein [Polynucleobacter meluiroseus]